MSVDYWLGVATPFALAGVLLVLGAVWTITTDWLSGHGWFAHLKWEWFDRWGDEVSFHARRTQRGRGGFYYGAYGTTAGWGSRWIQIGPFSAGRKRVRWALGEKPSEAEYLKSDYAREWETKHR